MSELKLSPFPVISPESMDYTDAEYDVKVTRLRNENKVEVGHSLHGNNMVARLLERRKAAFACIVCLRSTMYRKIFVADAVGDLEHSQIADYSESGHGSGGFLLESPWYRPIIVAVEAVEKTADAADGLNSLWEQCNIAIPRGSIIAYDDWQRFDGHMGGLLQINLDKDIPIGSLRIEPDTSGGYKFQIYVGGDDLFHRLKNNSSEDAEHRMSVLTHALSGCFRLLKESPFESKDDWKEYTNLLLLSETLESAGLGHWDQEDFSPEHAATVLYPHVFRQNLKEGDDD